MPVRDTPARVADEEGAAYVGHFVEVTTGVCGSQSLLAATSWDRLRAFTSKARGHRGCKRAVPGWLLCPRSNTSRTQVGQPDTSASHWFSWFVVGTLPVAHRRDVLLGGPGLQAQHVVVAIQIPTPGGDGSEEQGHQHCSPT